MASSLPDPSPVPEWVGRLLSEVNATVASMSSSFMRIPGSKVAVRYIRSSYQNDPIRSFIELCLVFFVVRYLTKPSYSVEKNQLKLTEREIDELIDEWTPEPLVEAPTELEQSYISKIPVISGPSGPKTKLANGKMVTNLASYNFLNFGNLERLRNKAVEVLHDYGVGACGPPGFYGTLDVHTQFELDVARFLGVEASIVYAQAFSTVSSVIPDFSKRGDIIVADKAVNFAIQKGLQISRSTVRWYEHNDMEDLERVLEEIRVEQLRSRKPLTRRFIVAEGLSENFGDIVDLPRIVELKKKFKYRLILDESWSFGVLGSHGRGVTEYFGVTPSEVDMIIGSMATTLCGGGGFCAGSKEVVDHQRITSISYVFSAAMPAILAVTASESISLLASKEGEDQISILMDNTNMLRSVLDKSEYLETTSDFNSPITHYRLNEWTVENYRLKSLQDQERVMQEIVDEANDHGVLIVRSHRIAAQEAFPPMPDLRITVSSGHTKKDIEKAAIVIRTAIARVLSKRR